uniref:Thioredoxin domain-containing protein n=1 Tax=Monodelphis domestica TaxID=13616 RepID=A0A5F8GH20_MONDO
MVKAKQKEKVLMDMTNNDDNIDLTINYEIFALPTVLAIKNGDVWAAYLVWSPEDLAIGLS